MHVKFRQQLAVASGDGITVNAGASDKISLRGLLLDGATRNIS
jgi:hypothetical protein